MPPAAPAQIAPAARFASPWASACASFADRQPGWLVRHGTWIAALLAISVVAVFALASANAYQERWAAARRSGRNIGAVIAHSLQSALDQYAVSLLHVAHTLRDPAVAGLAPELRSRLLFDRPTAMTGFVSRPFVLDAGGRLLYDSKAAVSTRVDLSGSEAFRGARQDSGTRLHIGVPDDVQLTDDRVVGLSVRLHDVSGEFGGVVVGGVRLGHLQLVLDRLQLGPRDAVSLFRDDGVMLARRPEAAWTVGASFASNPAFLASKRSGGDGAVETSEVDGIRRLYMATRVGGYPLTLSVGVAVADIEWPLFRRIGCVGLALLLLALGLFVNARMLASELRRRRTTEATIRHQVADLAEAHRTLQGRSVGESVVRAGLEAQLAISQRMTTLGQLAAGVALDVASALQTIGERGRQIHRHPQGPDVAEMACDIAYTAASAAHVARRLHAFAADPDSHVRRVDVLHLIGETCETLVHALGTGIKVEVDLPPNLPNLLLDSLQFQGVLVGLAVQARDAMPHGGRLAIAARLERVSGLVEHEVGLGAGSYLRIAIADTGTGLTMEDAAGAGDPNAVAARGRAGGLSLTMARAYAEQTGGAFSIASTRREGTTITLWLKLPEPLEGTSSAAGSERREPSASGAEEGVGVQTMARAA